VALAGSAAEIPEAAGALVVAPEAVAPPAAVPEASIPEALVSMGRLDRESQWERTV
jgi:hypothetical protein